MASGGVGKVDVMVVQSGNNNSAPEVYGSITVEITPPAGQPPLSYILFEQARDQAVRVPVNTAIPLQKDHVSAPLNSVFKVNANLWDANKEGPPDHQIVNGSVSFIVTDNGTNSDDIRALGGGDVKVDVIWSKKQE